MSDERKVLGAYCLCNTASINVYDIDYVDDAVLAGINNNEPEWCEMFEQFEIGEDEPKLGFLFGEIFVPFAEVMRI